MKNLFLLAIASLLIFSCKKNENISLQSVTPNTIDTLLVRVVQNDTNGITRMQTNSFYQYDNLKRLVSINVDHNNTIPTLISPYVEYTSVQYSGSNQLPVSSSTSHRQITNGVMNIVYDSTRYFYFYNSQNRKIADSVIKGSFNSTSSNFTVKSTYVAKYTYTGGIIYGVSNETSIAGNDVKYDTAFLDVSGNIVWINSAEYKNAGFYSKSSGSYYVTYDKFVNPYHRFGHIYPRIPTFMNHIVSNEALGVNNVETYTSTVTYLPMNAIACGGSIHTYLYPQNSLYPQEYRSILGYTKRFYYSII
jgi:hypothetical protein